MQATLTLNPDVNLFAIASSIFASPAPTSLSSGLTRLIDVINTIASGAVEIYSHSNSERLYEIAAPQKYLYRLESETSLTSKRHDGIQNAAHGVKALILEVISLALH